VGEGEESGDSGEAAAADALEADDDWPALSELDLDVCITGGVPGPDVTDADTNDSRRR
jgi:hypothetical protein